MSDEQLNNTLEKLLDRIDTLEAKVDDLSNSLTAIKTFSSKTGLLADAAGDSAAHFYNDAVSRGIDPIARAQAGMALAEKLSAPENMAIVETLLDKTGPTLTKLMNSPEFGQILAAADPKALAVAGSAGTALVETPSAGVEPLGPFGAFMKMRDPDVQRAVGFTLAVAKRFGQKLA